MSHYYLNDQNLKDQYKEINVTVLNKHFTFKTNAGVFSKHSLDFGSNLLIETVSISKNVKKIADIGSGYGPIGIIIGSENPHTNVYMYEINERAYELSLENIIKNNVKNVFAFNNNILEGVNEKFDVILTNPPIRAGKNVVFEIYNQVFKHLNDKGFLFVVIQRKQGAPSTFTYLSNLFSKTEVLVKNKGYWIIKASKLG